MKILLTGCLGQVGREIQELAHKNSFEIVGFDVNNLDITDSAEVKKVISVNKSVDFVINAAAYTAVDKAEDEQDEAFAINSDGVKNLALACKAHNIPLLHLSTDYVFDGNKAGAYTEDDQTNPLSIYSKSKLEGDLALMAIWEKHIILRVSWVFGRYGNNFVKTILRLAKEREQLNIVGDQFGCPTAAADIARVLLAIADRIKSGIAIKWGIYNYCNLPVTTWYAFAKAIIDLAQTRFKLKVNELKEITTIEFPMKAMRPKNSELMVKKIIKDYGIERMAWAEYLKQVIDEVEL